MLVIAICFLGILEKVGGGGGGGSSEYLLQGQAPLMDLYRASLVVVAETTRLK